MRKENTPLIETERLILRKFTQNDMNDILLITSDEEANRFLPWFPCKTMEDAQEYFNNRIFPDYTKDTAYRYAIALKTDNRPIGYITIGDIGQSNDIGYGLRTEFWHSGIVSEAGAAVVGRLKEVDFPFITATHDVNNPRSGEVMKKLGMTYRYSYEELCQPKGSLVVFRMYQLNLVGVEWTYTEYQKKYRHFIEQPI